MERKRTRTYGAWAAVSDSGVLQKQVRSNQDDIFDFRAAARAYCKKHRLHVRRAKIIVY